jgi:hypothetical protein
VERRESAMKLGKTLAAAALAAAGILGMEGIASAAPVSGASWAGSGENGGLGGQFVFLNSNGASPFSNSNSWFTWPIPDAVFSATLGGTTYSNTNDEGSIVFYGYPDTTSYGETFVAPGNATNFQFEISSNPGPGTGSEFVLATWDPSTFRAVAPLFSESVTVPVGSSEYVSSGAINVPLTAGTEYVAFLTVSNVSGVPELSTWAMMVLGFGGLGFAGYRKAKVSRVILSAA